MASDLNHVSVVGRLTADLEVKTENIREMRIATNSAKKDQSGEWSDYASYFDVTLFGDRWGGVGKYLVKGQQIAMTGRLEQQRWEKDGQKRSKVVIIASSVQLVGEKKANKTDAPAQAEAPAQQQIAADTPQPVAAGQPDDDIPF